MAALSDDLMNETEAMNGLTLARKMEHTFANPAAESAEMGMLDKLDKILTAIKQGQILTIDGRALVGATAGEMDTTLGQRRILAERGAV
jgi:hypothetical protein